jgi:D-glycero-D-manno-heptose 1,7-bisphosphate phosphatase
MKLVILDRDGVINQDSDRYIKSPAEWQPIPGAIEAIARMHQGGFRIVVATNQSGIGRGLFDMATFNAMNDKMMEMVFRQGGMFEEIAARYHVDLKGVPCVGDAMRDLQAADAVGAQPILVLTGKGKKTKEIGNLPRRTLVFADLAEVSRHLVAAKE